MHHASAPNHPAICSCLHPCYGVDSFSNLLPITLGIDRSLACFCPQSPSLVLAFVSAGEKHTRWWWTLQTFTGRTASPIDAIGIASMEGVATRSQDFKSYWQSCSSFNLISPSSNGHGQRGRQMMHLKDIVPSAANSVNTKFILLEKDNIRASKKCVVVNGVNKIQETKECLTLVADESASIYFLLWNTECEAFEPGDIIHLSNGIFSYHRNKLVLRSGRKGKAEKVGEFTMLFVEKPNMSDIQWQANENDLRKLTQESVTSTELQKSPS